MKTIKMQLSKNAVKDAFIKSTLKKHHMFLKKVDGEQNRYDVWFTEKIHGRLAYSEVTLSELYLHLKQIENKNEKEVLRTRLYKDVHKDRFVKENLKKRCFELKHRIGIYYNIYATQHDIAYGPVYSNRTLQQVFNILTSLNSFEYEDEKLFRAIFEEMVK